MANLQEMEKQVQAQARLRVIAGLPVVVLGLLAVYFLGTPFGDAGASAVGIIAAVHVLYILAARWMAAHVGQRCSARTLVVATAILDPLMLSAWLTMTGETGALFVCFYLFTILGFGFRIGPFAMRICQGASLVGFAMVLVIGPVWHLHPILGLSFFSILVVVPLYATSLIKNLRQAQERAEFDSQAKSQLLAKVSHELRTPLAGIITSAELLAGETAEPQTRTRANLILTLSNDLLLEINDLLDMAKFDAKALVLERAPFDVRALMRQIHHGLAVTAAAKNIRLTISVDPLVQKMVVGDVHCLGRILRNLAGNAVKFTSAGEVDMTLTLLEQGNNFYRIRFDVRDTGIGIAEALHQRIFEPFFQVSAGTARHYGGTGLGLHLARGLVQLMGSDITVQSDVGVGSRFSFEVRFPTVAMATDPDIAIAPAPPVFGKRILVADDYATNLHLIQALLARDRHHVVIATDGKQALERLAAERFDVVFLDYHMGDMDGAQVLQAYLAKTANPVPVFFLTADTTPVTTATLLATGAAGVLSKPVTNTTLRLAIVQVCRPGAADFVPASPADDASPLNAVASAGLATAPPANVAPYLDQALIAGLRRLSEQPDFLTLIVTSAIGDIERNGRALATALAAHDVALVNNAAHALRSIAATIGAVALGDTANKLMRLDSDALRSNALAAQLELDDVSAHTLTALRALRHEHSHAYDQPDRTTPCLKS